MAAGQRFLIADRAQRVANGDIAGVAGVCSRHRGQNRHVLACANSKTTAFRCIFADEGSRCYRCT